MDGRYQLNSEALEMASKAAADITKHEDMCSERYERINSTIARVENALSNGMTRLHGRLDKILWAIIIGLGALALALFGFVIQWVGRGG